MSRTTAEQACKTARAHLHLDDDAPCRRWIVHRLDRLGEAYFLVVLGDPDRPGGISTIDADTGEVLSSAVLPVTNPTQVMPKRAALAAADLPDDTPARLVWRSFPGSRSMLDPVWELRGASGTVYVDQRGRIWNSLEGHSRGGG
jgi:hypothetical protein